MKKASFIFATIWMACMLQGQFQKLETRMADGINMGEYPISTHMLRSEDNTFYRISGTYSTNLEHPMLPPGAINADFRTIYFIQYDANGDPLRGDYIYGAPGADYAASFEGGLTLFSSSNLPVEAGGQLIENLGRTRVEFLASYDREGQLIHLTDIWGPQEVYPYSRALMDPSDGSMYIYGTVGFPVYLPGYGSLGQGLESSDFFYIVKLDRFGQLLWVNQFGFDAAAQYPDLRNERLFIGNEGEVLLFAGYEPNTSPIIDGTTLPVYADGYGTLAVVWDRGGNVKRVESGSMKGWGYDTEIFSCFPMDDGGYIIAGNTVTGHYSLGGFQVDFAQGQDLSNQFLFKVDRDWNLLWDLPVPSMAYTYGEGKKGTRDEDFAIYDYYDAVIWRNYQIYLCANMGSAPFYIGEEYMEKPLPEGLYLAAVNAKDGRVSWARNMSSGWAQLTGLDVDRTGNVVVQGTMEGSQAFSETGATDETTSSFVFHAGFEHSGKLLWHNNARLSNTLNFYNIRPNDLMVMPAGQVFASWQVNEAAPVDVGGARLPSDKSPYSAWMVNLSPGMELGGRVLKQSAVVTKAMVKAIRTCPWGEFPVIDSVLVDENGFYRFRDLYPGHYALKAVPISPEEPFLPVYYGGHYMWNNNPFYGIEADFKANIIDILTVELPPPPNGQGELNGSIFYKDETDEGSKKGVMGRPVKKTAVILLKTSEKKSTKDITFEGFVETDENGFYVFEGIEDGTYLLLVDIPGLEMLSMHEIRIEGATLVSHLDYEVSNDGIQISEGTSARAKDKGELKLYPNPGNGLIFMALPEAGQYQALIYSSDGRLILRQDIHSQGGVVSMDIRDRVAGIYLIRIKGPGIDEDLMYIIN